MRILNAYMYLAGILDCFYIYTHLRTINYERVILSNGLFAFCYCFAVFGF